MAALDFQTIEERRFLRDLILPLPGETIQETASGDWPTIAGRDNLHSAHRRRATTSPGQLTHQAAYGGGALLFLEDLNDLSTRTRLGNDIRANALRDDRLADVRALVSTPDDDQVVIDLTLQPRGELDAETLSFVSSVPR